MGITKLYDHPEPSTTTHDQPSHNFTANTHNQPLVHCHYPQPPQLTITKSPPATNNSLATTILTTTNSELYFCYHYSPRGIPRAVSIYLPQEIFFLRKLEQVSLRINMLLMPMKTIIKKQYCLILVNFCADYFWGVINFLKKVPNYFYI